MNIGKMDKRINIYKKENAKDGYGGYTTVYTLVTKRYAQIIVPRTSVQSIQAAQTSTLIREIRIRKIDTTNLVGGKVVYKATEFEILHAYENFERAVILQCREIVKRS